MKKIFLFLGNEDKETLSGETADVYEEAARKAGFEIRRMNIGDMHFDPLLHKGYKVIQELEPDLKTFQENVRWADHLVFIHPVWWSTVPAILKGLIDRTWLPGFAFRFKPNGLGWQRLLKGKSARIIILRNTPDFVSTILFGKNSNFLKRATFWFAGIGPIRLTKFSRVETATPRRFDAWKAKIARLGSCGK